MTANPLPEQRTAVDGLHSFFLLSSSAAEQKRLAASAVKEREQRVWPPLHSAPALEINSRQPEVLDANSGTK